MKQTNRKLQSYLNFGALLIAVIVANILGNFYYKRIDLTAEKRYTLSETSNNLASKLDEKLYFRLYLEGEMSPRFKRLKMEIRDLILEFREASNGKIEFEVVNPFTGVGDKEMEEVLESYSNKGINPVRDVDKENPDETRIKYLLPGAQLFYKNQTVSVNFFDYDVGLDPEANISRAIDNIEYEVANALRLVTTEQKKRVVVADGNGEMIYEGFESLAQELQKYYDISALNMNFRDPNSALPWAEQIMADRENAETIFINGLHRRLNSNDLLMVVKPISDYTEQELYLIDQFIMQGGKVLWLIDPVRIEIDSFRNYKQVLAQNYGLENITASLFHYGVGIKNSLLMDQKCNRIPIPAAGRMELIDFPYFPLFQESSFSHIITKNMGTVWSQFPATLDPKVRPTLNMYPLLVSSPYSKVITTPAPVDLETIYMNMKDPDYRQSLRQGEQLSGVLVEGQFRSKFKFMKKYGDIKHLDSGSGQMIVIADGDIARNPSGSRGATFPTGYDKISGLTFSNKKFMLNCIDYLLEGKGLIEIRAKERKLRLLDPEKSRLEKSYWQWYSILAPVGIMLFFGLINYFIRNKRYT